MEAPNKFQFWISIKEGLWFFLDSKKLIKLIKHVFFDQKVICLMQIIVPKYKRRKKVKKKTNSFYRKNCKKEQFCFVLLVFFAFLDLENRFEQPPGACIIAAA